MFILDKTTNSIKEIASSKFKDLKYGERTHLQEWIESHPACLGEDLLIIQKEFNGFNDTNERLDLLALDKKGRLVIIENKLDDTGKDVTWQALKYASYCSSLSNDQIRDIFQKHLDKKNSGEDATLKLSEFFNDTPYDELDLNAPMSLWIILVAASFRKEVTSTVLWLSNHGIKIKCFQVKPYMIGEQVVLAVNQILPVHGTEEHMIRMADKLNEDVAIKEKMKDVYELRMEFWALLLAKIKGKTPIFQATNPTRDHWLSSGGTGISSISYSFVITKTYVSIELAIAKSETSINKTIFDMLTKLESEVTASFGDTLSWERLNDKKMSRVAFYFRGVNAYVKSDWESILGLLVPNMIKLELSFRHPLNVVKQQLNELGKPELIDVDQEV